MPHLAARPRRTLAVKVDGRARDGQPLLIIIDIVPDQIGHGDRAVTDRLAERPACNGADMLLELRDRRAIERPVPGIMYPRRDLVDQDLRSAISPHHERLDCEYTDIVERVGDPLRDRARLL